MSKNILIIHGHPVRETFIDCLKDTYKEAASNAGAEVREIVLRDLDFEINFKEGYRGNQSMEEDLIEAQKSISWADHLVFFYPNWWATYPALLKGFIDRVFLPGFAFNYQKGKPLPEQLLKGKTARLVVTMDSPVWYYYLVQKAPGHNSMRRAILEFCGLQPVRIKSLGPMRKSTEKQRLKWLQDMKRYGKEMT